MWRVVATALAVLLLQDEEWGQQGRPQDVTKPEWIVIMEMPRDPVVDPIFQLRLVVHASSEGEAVMKAFKHLQKYFSVNDSDKLIFSEAQQKK